MNSFEHQKTTNKKTKEKILSDFHTGNRIDDSDEAYEEDFKRTEEKIKEAEKNKNFTEVIRLKDNFLINKTVKAENDDNFANLPEQITKKEMEDTANARFEQKEELENKIKRNLDDDDLLGAEWNNRVLKQQFRKENIQEIIAKILPEIESTDTEEEITEKIAIAAAEKGTLENPLTPEQIQRNKEIANSLKKMHEDAKADRSKHHLSNMEEYIKNMDLQEQEEISEFIREELLAVEITERNPKYKEYFNLYLERIISASVFDKSAQEYIKKFEEVIGRELTDQEKMDFIERRRKKENSPASFTDKLTQDSIYHGKKAAAWTLDKMGWLGKKALIGTFVGLPIATVVGLSYGAYQGVKWGATGILSAVKYIVGWDKRTKF